MDYDDELQVDGRRATTMIENGVGTRIMVPLGFVNFVPSDLNVPGNESKQA